MCKSEQSRMDTLYSMGQVDDTITMAVNTFPLKQKLLSKANLK
jgi:hypothetical protein